MRYFRVGALLLSVILSPILSATCESYPLKIDGRVGGFDFEITGVLKWLDWSLTSNDDMNFEVSIWSIPAAGPRHGDIAVATHSKLFQAKDPSVSAVMRLLPPPVRPSKQRGEWLEILPYTNELNYFTVGKMTVKIRGGSIRLDINRTPRGAANGTIDLVGLLPDNEEVHYSATFHGVDPSDDLTDIPCFKRGY